MIEYFEGIFIQVFMFERVLNLNSSHNDDYVDGSDGMIVSRTSSERWWSVKAVEFARFVFTPTIKISDGETISRRGSSFVVSPNTTFSLSPS